MLLSIPVLTCSLLQPPSGRQAHYDSLRGDAPGTDRCNKQIDCPSPDYRRFGIV